MSNSQNNDDSEQEAKRILARVERDSESIGKSSLQRMGDLFVKHHGEDEGGSEPDPVETKAIWVGRILGACFVIYLMVHLWTTYIANG